ncbi:16447_t:CDS:1, partial [Gigaspora margarita]
LKAAKGKIKAGKKVKWFLFIEDVLLQNPKNRKIKEIYQTLGPNILAPLMPLIPISTNKRKKEWVLIDKENNKLETKKIIRKCNHKILTEHWSTKDNNTVPGYVKIEKSNGSLISEQNGEYSWLGQSKVLT